MDNFEFYAPTLFAFGRGQAAQTGALVRRFGGSRALLVYGGGSIKRNGAYGDVTAALDAVGVPFAELSGVQPNPRSGKVYEGIALARETGADFILAVGGGSAIDTAKAIAVGVPYDGDFWDFFSTRPAEVSLPVGVVLTLSATGSEGSNSTVITREEGNLKWGAVKSNVYRPAFAVMDPQYTCSLPAYQTACGAVDMLSHTMERYFTNTAHVNITDQLCEGVMRAIIAAAPAALAHPEDYDARAELMWAGTLAHNNSCGVGRQQDWACHQIEHELSAFYDCAHGAGLAAVTPAWMRYVLPHDVRRFAQFAVRVFGCEMDFADPARTAREGIGRLTAWFRALGMPTNLRELGVPDADIPAMVAHRGQKPKGFPFGGFVTIREEEMSAILRLAAEG